MGALAFASPFMLLALGLLPLIWWLIRITPPRPNREIFAPLSILAGLIRREERAASSPWWLLALRLSLAAIIILALSGPVLNPDQKAISTTGPLALVIDNGWASSDSWPKITETAGRLIDQAGTNGLTVHLVATAGKRSEAPALSADQARRILEALKPEPLGTDRSAAIAALSRGLGGEKPGTLAYLSDGLAEQSGAPITDLSGLSAADLRIIGDPAGPPPALAGTENRADELVATVLRIDDGTPLATEVTAFDGKGRAIASGTALFEPGADVAAATIKAPIELRNDIARLELGTRLTAAGVRLIDDSSRRRRVALISGEDRDRAQPLLSPLHYIERALSPFANLEKPAGNDLAVAIPAMIADQPSMIVMADIGRLPKTTEAALTAFIEKGGVLVRFAGPKLANAAEDDPLIPVRLRAGERFLGGALSWSEPQKLAPHGEDSPFAGLAVPDDITIKRQVLAEPDPDLDKATWARLADGTPLVTARALGAGRIVLFHVGADASWSNLPLSGHFVDMLRRILQFAHGGGALDESGATVLQPWRLLAADGRLLSDAAGALPLVIKPGIVPAAGVDNPPGLYGDADGQVALNLMPADARLRPLDIKATGLAVTALAGSAAIDLQPWLLLLAAFLLIADTLAIAFLSGLLRRNPRGQAAAMVVILALAGLIAIPASHAIAEDTRPGDEALLKRLDTTHLAYVITGEDDVDTLSKQGLKGLSDYLYYRTTLEPGEPVGVDIEADELSVFPILYWPVSATAPMPSDAAISRIGAYMRSGGTVLFDTRDQFSTLSLSGTVSPNTARLQDILATIDVPPLEAVPSDHVLTKAFYLLKSFPGRYAGSPLWVEALPERGDNEGDRPARAGDGVTPIMITGNDLAGAWAVDDTGNPVQPVVPGDNDQREMAFRVGINIMMYMLTGNYKADQVHVPALLERLGQ